MDGSVHYVIGSGPAGVSAAVALLRRGCQVRMLDAGLELEADRQIVTDTLARQDHRDWDQRNIARIKENMRSNSGGIPLKYAYGSDFPYRESAENIPYRASNVGIAPTLAKGGFSNVWGSAILPYLAEEIAEWPITSTDLVPHYRDVISFMGLAGTHDGLAARFPLYTEAPNALPTSRQMNAFLHTLEQHKTELNREGIIFGRSRLAVTARNQFGFSCVACGLCMYGCPYGLIYNSGQTLEKLRQNPNFTYHKGLIVEYLSEENERVMIRARKIDSSDSQTFSGSRAYIAAGVISTTRLMLNSMRVFNHILEMKDSQYFLLPLLRFHATPNVMSEELHTLAQGFIEIFDQEISPKSIHLQIYTYNDLFKQVVEEKLGPAYPALKALADPLLKSFLGRLLLIQGYLHSDLSSTIKVTMEPPRENPTGGIVLEQRPNKATIPTVRKLIAKLRRNRRLLKATPLSPLLKVGEPGRGFHSGGTLPMSHRPARFETDIWGRLSGYQRTHIVDATIFPSIPASTITLSVMANAHRIASQKLDG